MAEAYNETRTQPLPKFATSWKGPFTNIAEVVAQSGMNMSSSGFGGGSGTGGTTGSGSSHSSGFALTASLKHILLVLTASTLAIVLSSWWQDFKPRTELPPFYIVVFFFSFLQNITFDSLVPLPFFPFHLDCPPCTRDINTAYFCLRETISFRFCLDTL